MSLSDEQARREDLLRRVEQAMKDDLPFQGERCPETNLHFDVGFGGGTWAQQTERFKTLVADPNWRAFISVASPEIFRKIKY